MVKLCTDRPRQSSTGGSQMKRIGAIIRRSISSVAVPLAALALLVSLASEAFAEGKIRIAEQFGVSYLPLQMMRKNNLIEKHGKEQGLDIEVEWARFSGGAAMNDALLSDNIDIGAGGVGPLLVIW